MPARRQCSNHELIMYVHAACFRYARFMHANQEAVQAALADANSIAQEVIGAMRTVAAFAAERHEHARYARQIDRFYGLIMRQFVVQGVYFMVCNTFLINTCVQAALLAYGAFLIEKKLLAHTVLLAFMLYQAQLQEYAQNLLNSFTSLLKSSGAAAKVFDYIERRPRYRHASPTAGDGGDAWDSLDKSGSTAGEARVGGPIGANGRPHAGGDHRPDGRGECGGWAESGRVELRDVYFCYPSRPNVLVLKGLSLTVRPGESVALYDTGQLSNPSNPVSACATSMPGLRHTATRPHAFAGFHLSPVLTRLRSTRVRRQRRSIG